MLTYSIWAGNYALVVPQQHRQIIARGRVEQAGHPRVRVRARPRHAPRVADRGQGGGGRPRKDEDARLHGAALARRPAGDRGRRAGGRIRRDHAAVVRLEVAGRHRHEESRRHDPQSARPPTVRRGRGGASGAAPLRGARRRASSACSTTPRSGPRASTITWRRSCASASACASSSAAASRTRAGRRRPICSASCSAADAIVSGIGD